jgi:tRNA (guanine-N7-)-methyltransferase
MSRGAQLKVSRTRSIPEPNEYIDALYGEFAKYCLDEEAAPLQKGKWRGDVFATAGNAALDLEIGTGNGYHFAQRAASNSARLLLGIELKYKPLIQSIRRAVRAGASNARMARYNAALVHELFTEHEIDDVFIHFPDPWEKIRQQKHRLLQSEFLRRLWHVQKPGSLVEFKTDNQNYYDWAMKNIGASPYVIEAESRDLHNSICAESNFITHFEGLFLRQGLPIYFARLRKSSAE